MRAIILAAGFGQRMGALTEQIHKTLLPIGDETVLDRIVLNLLEAGISRITVVTGYRREEIRDHLAKRFSGLKFDYVDNAEYRTTNNLVSLHLALEAAPLDSDIILIESDLVFEAGILKRLLASPYPNVALVDHHSPGMDGTVVTLDGSVITGVIPPHLQGKNFSFADKYKTLNIYKFSLDFVSGPFRDLLAFYIRSLNKSYYELILGVIVYLRSAQIHAEIVAGQRWCEIDDANDLATARYTFDPSCRSATLHQAQGGYWNYGVLDFCFLRNAFFPTPAVISEMENAFRTVLGHYGSAQPVLDAKMAYFQKCPPESLVALNGLSQIYPWLAERFRGCRALVPAPTFGEYARAFPGAATYSDSEAGFDLDEIEDKAANAEVICLVNPNNPTGSILPTAWISDLGRRHRSALFLLDESFIDFSTEPSFLPRLGEEPQPNVVVLKSLSKALGIPGLRLGWAYSANKEFIQSLRNSLPIWNINSVAENFLEIILKHRPAIADSFTQTARERDYLRDRLRELPGVENLAPSAANFLLVRFRGDAKQLDEKLDLLLRNQNIHVKSCSSKFGGARAYARIAVGTPQDNVRLIDALGPYFSHE